MRDPERIPLILSAFEGHWRRYPYQRLGQVMVNLMRANWPVVSEDEGRVLFNVENATLLRWIGSGDSGQA